MAEQSMFFYDVRSIPISVVFALLLTVGFASQCLGQAEDLFGDHTADPVKLFEKGQNHHARGEYALALEFYEQAIKIRPEFPEAEFQRGNSLISLRRLQEGEEALRKAISLRKDWSLPYSALGSLLLRLDRVTEAETSLRQALRFNPRDQMALRLLASLRLNAGDAREALELARVATSEEDDAPVAAWIVRAMAERATGDNAAAQKSLDRVLQLDPSNTAALIERAELHIVNGDYDKGIEDLRKAERLSPNDKQIAVRLASIYEKSGDIAQAEEIAKAAGLITTAPSGEGLAQVIGTPEEIEAANSDIPDVAEPALLGLIAKNPNNPALFARLGEINRAGDPQRSLDYYRRAVELQPNSVSYATGYAAALVKTRRFEEAVVLLRRIVAVAPENYAAHSNLATALYSLKLYKEALAEYEWLRSKRPDLTIIHYFIATAHDNLGQYQDALAAYESFLAQADANSNQLEIDKVKLRLPTIKRQIQLKEGAKRSKEN